VRVKKSQQILHFNLNFFFVEEFESFETEDKLDSGSVITNKNFFFNIYV